MGNGIKVALCKTLFILVLAGLSACAGQTPYMLSEEYEHDVWMLARKNAQRQLGYEIVALIQRLDRLGASAPRTGQGQELARYGFCRVELRGGAVGDPGIGHRDIDCNIDLSETPCTPGNPCAEYLKLLPWELNQEADGGRCERAPKPACSLRLSTGEGRPSVGITWWVLDSDEISVLFSDPVTRVWVADQFRGHRRVTVYQGAIPSILFFRFTGPPIP